MFSFIFENEFLVLVLIVLIIVSTVHGIRSLLYLNRQYMDQRRYLAQTTSVKPALNSSMMRAEQVNRFAKSGYDDIKVTINRDYKTIVLVLRKSSSWKFSNSNSQLLTCGDWSDYEKPQKSSINEAVSASVSVASAGAFYARTQGTLQGAEYSSSS